MSIQQVGSYLVYPNAHEGTFEATSLDEDWSDTAASEHELARKLASHERERREAKPILASKSGR